MPSQEKLVGGPYTANQTLALGRCELTRIKLVATGGAPCTVVLFDGAQDMITMVADVLLPDEYAGNEKLSFRTDIGILFQAGAGKLYLYFS